GKTWHTTARDLGLRLDPGELANAAYTVGRDGGPFSRLGDQVGTLARGRTISVTRPTPPPASHPAPSTPPRAIDPPPLAAPLTLTFADKSFPLEHVDIVKLISLSGGTKPGQPAVVNVDDKAVRSWAARLAKDVDQTVQEPRFAFRGGGLKVVRPSKQGRTLDQ